MTKKRSFKYKERHNKFKHKQIGYDTVMFHIFNENLYLSEENKRVFLSFFQVVLSRIELKLNGLIEIQTFFECIHLNCSVDHVVVTGNVELLANPLEHLCDETDTYLFDPANKQMTHTK